MVEEKPCRHEYVRIFQRKLKGLERRMVCTRAFLPIGFKLGDFGHLSEGSYCFCAKCRLRLFPKRTQAEKAQARLANAASLKNKASLGGEAEELDLVSSVEGEINDELLEDEIKAAQVSDQDEDGPKIDIHVEELEPEMVDVQDIEAEGVKLNDEEESSVLSEEEEM